MADEITQHYPVAAMKVDGDELTLQLLHVDDIIRS